MSAAQKSNKDEHERNPTWQDLLDKNLRVSIDAKEDNTSERPWDSQEIYALACLTARYGCDSFVVMQNTCEDLKARSAKDIMDKIQEVHGLIRKTDRQFREQYFASCDKRRPKIVRPLKEDIHNWCQAVMKASVNDPSAQVATETLSLTLEECGEAPKPRGSAKKFKTEPNYAKIYEEVNRMISLKHPSMNLSPLDSAVLLSIIEEVEREVSQNHYRMPAYSRIFRDLQLGFFDEFSLYRRINRAPWVGAHLNTFGLTKEQISLWEEDEEDEDSDIELPVVKPKKRKIVESEEE